MRDQALSQIYHDICEDVQKMVQKEIVADELNIHTVMQTLWRLYR